MPRPAGPLQSRFGHRLLLSFMLCALIPVGVAGLVLQRTLSGELERQASVRLHEEAKALGFTLLQRLQTLEYGLRAGVSSPDGRTGGTSPQGPFLSITRTPSPAGNSAANSPVDPRVRLRLQANGGDPPRLFLNIPVQGMAGISSLEAEIAPDSLWPVLDPAAIASDAEVMVLDDRGRVLYTTSPAPAEDQLARRMRDDTLPVGAFDWTSNGERFIASRWTLFLKPGFGVDAWQVVLSQPRASVTAPLARFRRTFLPMLLLSLLVALIIGIGEIRRNIRPLRALHEGAERVANQDFASRVDIATGDEFQALATALNVMAERLGTQFAELNQSNSGLREQIRERELAERALKETEGQLRQAQKMEAIGTLAGGVAHDFNNLLTVISSYTDLALSSISPDDPVHKDLEEVAGAAHRAAGLTRQLLTFSRKQVVDLRILDVNEIVRASEKLLRRLIGAQVDFRVDLPAGESWVFGDQGQVDQVLMNLVVNARDAMPDGGIITVRTAVTILDQELATALSLTPGPHVALTVEDTGVGMSETTQARIFEPFFTTKPPGQGTGLGLSTVYGIVKQSGGAVQLHSVLGQGTRFTVYLRGVAPESGLTGAPAMSAPRHRGAGTILIVEDESPVRQLAKRVLDEAGYLVLTAENGEEALKIAYEHPGTIDLLLTDVVMPKMGGKRLSTSLGQSRPGMRTLYMSGYYEQNTQGTDGLGDTVALLQKPFQPGQLLQAVVEILASGETAEMARAAGQGASTGGPA